MITLPAKLFSAALATCVAIWHITFIILERCSTKLLLLLLFEPSGPWNLFFDIVKKRLLVFLSPSNLSVLLLVLHVFCRIYMTYSAAWIHIWKNFRRFSGRWPRHVSSARQNLIRPKTIFYHPVFHSWKILIIIINNESCPWLITRLVLAAGEWGGGGRLCANS